MTGEGIDNALRIGPAAAALGVSVDTLRRWERAGRVKFERRGNQRYLHADEVARLMRERSSPGRSSARNRLGGIVLAVKRDGVMAQVEMACGPYRVVSLMSREAADELGLEPGSRAEAVIKATGVVIETR
jgi:molybdopterin-binding protein